VWAVCVGRHAPRHDLHPVAAADLGQKAVEIEEPVETLVAPAHLLNISDNDNNSYTTTATISTLPAPLEALPTPMATALQIGSKAILCEL
jgi:hypothetical protein